MFGFTKKKKEEPIISPPVNTSNEIVLTEEQIKRYDRELKATNSKVVTVEEIHEAFYTEVDALLDSCSIKHSLESELSDVLKKNERLVSLGFTSTSISKVAVKEHRRIDKLENENKAKIAIIDAIEYYSQKYPQYKFITEESVIKLCNKYKLIYGPVKNYIGDVPDKNLIDIENFSIEQKDEAYEKIVRMDWEIYRDGDCDYADVKAYERTIETYKEHNFRGHTSQFNKKPFEIVAPAKDFNLDGMRLKDGIKLVKKPIKVEDPIVLQPVRHGGKTHYLIVTAWGDEASDPSVMNANHN